MRVVLQRLAIGLYALGGCGGETGVEQSRTGHGEAGSDPTTGIDAASGIDPDGAGGTASMPAQDAIVDTVAADATTNVSDATDAFGPCTPLSYTEAPNDVRVGTGCPLDPSLPECKTADVGALVDRIGDPQSVACVNASGAAHGCAPFMAVRTSMNVFIPFDACSVKLTIDKVQDCGSRILIDYSAFDKCVQCDAVFIAYRMLVLPKDLRPVVAVRHDRRAEPCVN